MFPFENYGDHYGFQRRELLACSQSGRPWLLQAVGTAKAMRELWPGASLRFVGVIPAVSGGRLTGDLKAEFYRVLESRLRERDPNVSDKEIAARTDSGMADAVRIQHSADLILENTPGADTEELFGRLKEFALGKFVRPKNAPCTPRDTILTPGFGYSITPVPKFSDRPGRENRVHFSYALPFFFRSA